MKYLLIAFLMLSACAPVNPKNGPGGDNGPTYDQEVLVGAFNIQIFGDSKYSNVTVRNQILQILPRYDVVLIQEIRDADASSINALFADLNNAQGGKYSMVLGSRVGRTSSKEQYAYIYNNQKLQVEQSFEFNDVSDNFEREPLSTLFKVKNNNQKFFLIGLHSKPEDAVQEINKLFDVFTVAESTFGTSQGMILGDLNADCSYVSDSEFQDLNLYRDSRFRFLFSKTGDSTIGNSDCQYDQIVTHADLTDNLVSGSEVVYDILSFLGITQSQGEAISDHFPVEAKFLF